MRIELTRSEDVCREVAGFLFDFYHNKQLLYHSLVLEEGIGVTWNTSSDKRRGQHVQRVAYQIGWSFADGSSDRQTTSDQRETGKFDEIISPLIRVFRTPENSVSSINFVRRNLTSTNCLC